VSAEVEVILILDVVEYYSDDGPETFGSMRFNKIPSQGDVIMLRWIDGRPAYEATVVSVEVESRGRIVVSRDLVFLQSKKFPLPPAGPRAFCVCSGCGKEHEVSREVPVPPGWRAFSVRRWPWGSGFEEMGSLYLRLCASCVGGMDAGPDPIAVLPPARKLVHEMSRDEILNEMRQDGWAVGVHNDYNQGGKRMTFWLFTHPSGHFVKGEGETDDVALAEAFNKKRTIASRP
jgi:hypothetical protein